MTIATVIIIPDIAIIVLVAERDRDMWDAVKNVSAKGMSSIILMQYGRSVLICKNLQESS